MKTRITHTKIWESGWFHDLSKNSKFFFLYLITNHRINLCGAYHLPHHIIPIETGLTKAEIEKCKAEISRPSERYPMGKVTFFDEWVYVRNAQKYGGYSGEKNEKAIERELELLPQDIRKCFIEGKCDRVSIGYTDFEIPVDSPINHKSEIINKKSEEGSAEGSVEFLRNVPKDAIDEFTEKFNVYEQGIRTKAEELYDWVKSKGKERSYKDFRAFLRNALRKDFGVRKPEDLETMERIRRTKESLEAGPSSFAKSLAGKMKM